MSFKHKKITISELKKIVNESSDNFENTFRHIFPFGTINDREAYRTMFEIGKIVKKYLDQDTGYDNFFLLNTILKKLLNEIYGKGIQEKALLWNKIDEIIMFYFDDEDLGTHCVRNVLDFLEKEDW